MTRKDPHGDASTVLAPDSDRAAIMAAETRTVAGGSARAVATSPMPAAIGRYQVVGRIGEGGMGVVYEALDPELKRRVAVKVVRGAGGDAVGQGRLLREAQAMAQLSHASVVPVFDVGALAEADGGGVFIAMELVEGQTLRDWLKSTKRPWKAVVANLVAAGRGLAAAHAAGIVHRDFKPANVLVGMDGRVRVTDFGLARVDDAVFGESDAAGVDASDAHVGTAPGGAARETRTGAIAGTPGYLAPEALDGVIDARGDQFAFCVSLYEGLYGERPFDAGSGEGRSPLVSMAEEVKRGAVREPPRGAKVPGWLRAMVLRGLAADPAARWPSMTALLDAIERVPRRRRRLVAAFALVSVVAAFAALAVMAESSRRGAGPTPCKGFEERLPASGTTVHARPPRRGSCATGPCTSAIPGSAPRLSSISTRPTGPSRRSERVRPPRCAKRSRASRPTCACAAWASACARSRSSRAHSQRRRPGR